jgi:hypothetical protein
MVIEIIWDPSHEDVDGNEKADEAAKEAAKSEGNNPNIPTSIHKPLKSLRSVCIKRDVTNDWDRYFLATYKEFMRWELPTGLKCLASAWVGDVINVGRDHAP